MNKIKMFRNIKDLRKKEYEREAGWNNRFTVNDSNHQTSSNVSILAANGLPDNHTLLRPKHLRPSSTKTKIKVEAHQRTKSAVKPPQPVQPVQNEILNSDPLYTQIKSLWNILGVTTSYRNIFDNVSLQLVPLYREGYFNYEIKQLMNLSNIISKINKDIESREKIIQLLIKFDKFILMEEIPENHTNGVSHEKLITDIIKTLGDLRTISLSIVNSYLSIRKEISYDVVMNKHDIDLIVNFNKNYLLQMKNDTDFLAKTSLSKYFSFANESDPFLTAIAIEETTESSHKYTLPIDNTMIERIKECQYIMLQEMLYNECSKVSKVDSTMSSYSMKSIKSAKKITKGYNYDIDSLISSKKDNRKFNSNTSKKDLKPIRSLKSPDFMKIRKRNLMNSESKYSGNATEVKTPKKMSVNASSTENQFEDSKTQEKKILHSKSHTINKSEIDCLDETDLMKIDEIINRSIKQKLEIDKKKNNSKIESEPAKENKELNELIINDQKEFSNQQTEEIKKEEKPKEEEKEDPGRRTHELLNKMDDFLKQSQSYDVTQSNIIQPEQVKDNDEIKEDIRDSIHDDIEIKEKDPSKEKMIIKDMSLHDADSINNLPYHYSIFSGDLSSISNLYTDYYQKISDDQKTAFNLKEDINSYLVGTFPKIILVKDTSGCFVGLITCSIETVSEGVKTINITSISSISDDTLGQILLNFVNYCNTNIPYEEITLDFYYGIKDGQFYMVKTIESAIKTEAKFKWVNMENDGVNRKIKYKHRKGKAGSVTASIMNTDYFSQKGINVIAIQSGVLFSMEQFSDEMEREVFNTPVKEKNDFNLLCLIAEVISHYDYKLVVQDEESNEISSFVNTISLDKLRNLTKDIIKTNIGFPEEMIDFINENLVEIAGLVNNEMRNEKFLAGSLMKIDCNFDNIIKSELNGYEYNIIIHDIEVFELNKDEQSEKFYLLHSTNDNISFLIYEFTSTEGSLCQLLKGDDNEMNITNAFKSIYMQIDQQPASLKKKMYLPSFKIERSDLYNNPSIFKGVKLLNESSEFIVKNINLFEKIEFGLVEDKEGVIKFDGDNTEESIIIKNDFLIATINSDLLCDLQIPTISAFVVHKENWIKH